VVLGRNERFNVMRHFLALILICSPPECALSQLAFDKIRAGMPERNTFHCVFCVLPTEALLCGEKGKLTRSTDDPAQSSDAVVYETHGARQRIAYS